MENLHFEDPNIKYRNLYHFQKHWVKTEILSASIRGVKAVSTSFALGAHVVTMPPNVFEKMYNHVLTDKGLQLFDADWASVVANNK